MISLGIDIGGTGCKCVAFRDDGKQLALSYREYPLEPGNPNLPAEILRESIISVIAECAAKLDDPADVKAITVASFGEAFVAVGEDGRPLMDVLIYFGVADTKLFNDVIEKIGVEKCMSIARTMPDASYSLSKMLNTLRNAPAPVKKFLFIAGYIGFVLSGEMKASEVLACRSLLYDVKERRWSEEMMDGAGISPDLLPEVVPTGAAIGTILPSVAEVLGLPKDVRILLGSHDQIVNALGAGCDYPGDAVNTTGTVECITPIYESIPDSLEMQYNNYAVVPYFDRGYTTYAYSLSGGSVVRWYRDALGAHLRESAKAQGKSIYDLMNETCPEEPSSLLVLPYLQGMGGTPDVDMEATGTIFGLTTRTQLPDIYRAILEGITFEDRYNLEKLKGYGISPKRLLACGGGAKSPAWLRIKADILGIPILPVDFDETGAMGSAVLGFAEVTGEDPFAIATRFRKYLPEIEPETRFSDIYEKQYERFKTYRARYVAERKEAK